jgi:hypothetical protein
MPRLSPHIAFLALALWLLSNWTGAHGHYCFDGQEPPISVHLHLDGHQPHSHLDTHEAHGHHPDEAHQDADIELNQSALTKLSKIDLAVVLLAALTLTLLILPSAIFTRAYRGFYPRVPVYWRPLLRAPPFTA